MPTFADFTADVEHPALDTPLWKFGAVNNAAAQPPVTLTMPPTPVIVVRYFRVASIFPRAHAGTYVVQTAATNVRNLPSPSICQGPNQLETIRYEMPISKADISQLNLTHGTKKLKSGKKV